MSLERLQGILYCITPFSLVDNKTWVTKSYLFGFHQKGQELWHHQYQSTTMGTPAFPLFHAVTTKTMQLWWVSQLQIASISPQIASLMNNLDCLLCKTTTSNCSILMKQQLVLQHTLDLSLNSRELFCWDLVHFDFQFVVLHTISSVSFLPLV